MADGYDVTDITKTVYSAPGQLAAPALEVSFSTKPKAIAGSIIVPAANFTVDEVRTLLENAAARLEAVMAL